MKKIWIALLLAAALAGCTPSEPSSSAGDGGSTLSQLEVQDESSPESSEAEAPLPPAPVQPGDTVPSTTEAAVQQPAELAWWQKELTDEKILPGESCGPTTEYYIYDDAAKISWNGYDIFSRSPGSQTDDLAGYRVDLLLDSAQEADDLGQPILTGSFFEIVTPEDVKLTGHFYEKGIELTRSLPGQGYGDQVKLSLDEADYTLIQNRIIASKDNSNWQNSTGEASPRSWYWPSWLTMMRESRATEVTFTNQSGDSKTYTGNDITYYLFDDIAAKVSGSGTFTDQTELPDSDKVTVTFNNGLVYHIYANENNLLVTASDMEQGLLYPLGSKVNTYGKYALGVLNPPTGKPVIYLYPEEPTDCTVTVDYDAFTYTYPTYGSGWKVTAYPDGRLINLADGSEHYYLFWEGGKRIDWEFESGFVVKGSDTESFLREKLAYLGLTPREYNDFITYWVPRMQDSPYNLITFAGEQYEQLAPLTVTPTPDSVLRVHMVYQSLEEPVEIPEQQLQPFQRTGFTVVEWGGTDANYMK